MEIDTMAEPKNKRLKILVADDEDIILDLYRKILSQAQDLYDLTFCHQVEQAVQAVDTAVAQGLPFVAAFLDVSMPPGPDGIWAAENIRKLDPDIQIVIVTDLTDIDPSDIERRVPPVDRLLFIKKPFHSSEIRHFVSTLAARWEAENQLKNINRQLDSIVEKPTTQLQELNQEIHHKITELSRADKELRKTKEQLENLIESSLDPIVLSDGNGYITKPNKTFLKLLGYSEEEVIGLPVYKFSVIEEGTYESMTGEMVHIGQDFFKDNFEKIYQLSDKGKISNWETFYVNKDNKIIPVTQNIVYLTDENCNITNSFGIVRDITEQRKSELELIKSKEAALEASQSKSHFLANMSHEIRTPMNGVIGFTDMLLNTDLDPEQTDYAKTIKRSSEALLFLINDILDFSKIEAGKIDIEEIIFDLEYTAYDVCELIGPRIKKRAVEILCRIGDNLPAQVKGDPYRIKQVLLNLMGNAEKFTEKGEIELSLDIEEERNDFVMIHAKVRDTGIGIPAHRIDSVFEMFQQADDTTTRKHGGTGLGLSICRKIAGLMGGNIWVESEEGRGSTFHFTALLKKSEGRQIKRFPSVALTGKKALITDDNRANLEILTHIIESSGMLVSGFASGKEAFEAARNALENKAPFHICILDIRMPDISGYELAKKIGTLHDNKIPLLAFSASIKGDASKCQEAGFDGFLPKPINRIKLLQMIERLLGGVLDQNKENKIHTQHSIREDAKHATSILLAEDNPVNQKLALKLLTKAGYQISAADNGQEVVDKFISEPHKYDIIFMDVQMPELNGLEATKILRDKGFTQIPIVALTANVMKGDREKCLAAGMNDYVPKPIRREVVFEMLKKWVFKGGGHEF